MHGTGAFNAFGVMIMGGSVVTLEHSHFDPDELLATIERERVNSIAIVGDAFAKPILRALDAQPGRYDITSLRVIVSSGVMWSAETKQGLLHHNPRMMLVDSFGSSEAVGMATSISTGDKAVQTAKFHPGMVRECMDHDECAEGGHGRRRHGCARAAGGCACGRRPHHRCRSGRVD